MIGVLKFKLTSGAKKYINGYYGAWDRVCSPWSCGGLVMKIRLGSLTQKSGLGVNKTMNSTLYVLQTGFF
ncbi:hypothetical protein BRADI_4g17244v3 [Brachypodium distachyon]|uniref:Uncharacterized protein n=1 Tax=Brachypodium distachyon TaxID=15368 RepID=A0A0Q3EPW1_BRADI|nr:hypothetical protein BRADI_4g17244v3 [Brachypodium distachyon]